jgi:hypothetical protein
MDLTRYDPKRVVLVTAGLAAAGAVTGGLAGAVAIGVVGVITDGFRATLSGPAVLLMAGQIGAVLGAVLAPATSWLLLRHVPLGRVFGALMGGTIAGGIVGGFSLGRLGSTNRSTLLPQAFC